MSLENVFRAVPLLLRCGRFVLQFSKERGFSDLIVHVEFGKCTHVLNLVLLEPSEPIYGHPRETPSEVHEL